MGFGAKPQHIVPLGFGAKPQLFFVVFLCAALQVFQKNLQNTLDNLWEVWYTTPIKSEDGMSNARKTVAESRRRCESGTETSAKNFPEPPPERRTASRHGRDRTLQRENMMVFGERVPWDHNRVVPRKKGLSS